ncbi:MAG: TIM barrel protein [Solirubrobacteraceae bacterium]
MHQFNPERIVAGDTLAGAGEFLLAPLRRAVERYALRAAVEHLEMTAEDVAHGDPFRAEHTYEREPTHAKVARAVAGLGELMDGYEFHYPQELSEENLEPVTEALGGHEIACIATGLNLEPRFGKGALSSPDPGLRREALEISLRAADFAASVGASLICWPGIEGYNYPFQTDYARAWADFVDGIGRLAERCNEQGVQFLLEHKNSEPAMKIFMRNIGMTLHVIHSLRRNGIEAVKVNMDWQHLIMNGEIWPNTRRSWSTTAPSGTSTQTRAGEPSTTTTWSARPRSWRLSSWP